jgi:hypothetical protein
LTITRACFHFDHNRRTATQKSRSSDYKLRPPIAALQGHELLAQNQILQKEITEALKRSEQQPQQVEHDKVYIIEFTPDQPFGEGQPLFWNLMARIQRPDNLL